MKQRVIFYYFFSAFIPEDADITLILFGSPRDSATLS